MSTKLPPESVRVLGSGPEQAPPGLSEVTINISVHRADENATAPDPRNRGKKKGTFTSPDPLVRVHSGTWVKWRLVGLPGTATFTVNFDNGSPFAVSTISDETAREAINDGSFHYQVSVTSGGETFSIPHCPEIEVGTP